ncbi:hypothetical protein, partial [Yersinia enterocolitica]|uniref:hypothetical protein n=1 Tax=Yersinia enterocolitica TaxID=630 RepID=UPI003F438D22
YIFAMACYIRSSHIVKILEWRQSKRVDKQDGYYDPNGTFPLHLDQLFQKTILVLMCRASQRPDLLVPDDELNWLAGVNAKDSG